MKIILAFCILLMVVCTSTAADYTKPFIHIVAPNLAESSNFISSNANMPNLVFKLDIKGIPLTDIKEYRWWLRVNYTSRLLKFTPELSSFGCASHKPSEVTVWTLPTGNIHDMCQKDLSQRNTWIVTSEPVLDLGKPLQIREPNGTLQNISFEEEENALVYKGKAIYGGGTIEVFAKVIYQNPSGQQESITVHYPGSIAEANQEHYLKGLNPSSQQIKQVVHEITVSLTSTKLTPTQAKLKQEITGGTTAAPIPPALAAVLAPLLDGIACRETQRKHFCDNLNCLGVERVPGHPILSFDGGYGMYQLTYPQPTYYEKWNWKEGLLTTIRHLYSHVPYAHKIASMTSDKELQERIYFRELISRHNAANVQYYELDGTRRPIICREQVAFLNSAPNTDPIYRKNLEKNQGLLQALEMFGRELQSKIGVECPSDMGRDIYYRHTGNTIEVLTISACRPGQHQLMDQTKKISSATTLPENFLPGIVKFGAELVDNKFAACEQAGFNKNAARKIQGKFIEPNIYIIQSVGRCHNSPTCYVDVDTGSNCLTTEDREEL